METTKHARAWSSAAVAVAVVLAAGIALGALGSDDPSSESAQTSAGNGVDRAFVGAMLAHHQSAVRMSKVAVLHAQSMFVRELAGDIISMQKLEMATMRAIASRLDAAGIEATRLGFPEHQTGVDPETSKLASATPFDRAWVDAMIPHHQGAIRMARAELAKGSNDHAKQLATEIIDAQASEIEVMNTFRAAKFGAPSPAGGVPAEHAQRGHPIDR